MTGEQDLLCGLISGLFAREVSGGTDVALRPSFVIRTLLIVAGILGKPYFICAPGELCESV